MRTTSNLKGFGRQAGDRIRETAQNWADKTRAASAVAMERAQDACRVAQDKVSVGARVCDSNIRAHPYSSIGIAFGIGVLIGYLVKRTRD